MGNKETVIVTNQTNSQPQTARTATNANAQPHKTVGNAAQFEHVTTNSSPSTIVSNERTMLTLPRIFPSPAGTVIKYISQRKEPKGREDKTKTGAVSPKSAPSPVGATHPDYKKAEGHKKENAPPPSPKAVLQSPVQQDESPHRKATEIQKEKAPTPVLPKSSPSPVHSHRGKASPSTSHRHNHQEAAGQESVFTGGAGHVHEVRQTAQSVFVNNQGATDAKHAPPKTVSPAPVRKAVRFQSPHRKATEIPKEKAAASVSPKSSPSPVHSHRGKASPTASRRHHHKKDVVQESVFAGGAGHVHDVKQTTQSVFTDIQGATDVKHATSTTERPPPGILAAPAPAYYIDIAPKTNLIGTPVAGTPAANVAKNTKESLQCTKQRELQKRPLRVSCNV